MRTSVPGSEASVSLTCAGHTAARRHGFGKPLERGFTLIELMVVVLIIGVAAAVTSLALRDPIETQLEREAARLSALLDTARTEARSLGVAAFWAPVKPSDNLSGSASANVAMANFRFDGLPEKNELPTRWLDPRIVVEIPQAQHIVLGPEPLIGAQDIILRLEDHQLTLGTDGLGPFVVRNRDASDKQRQAN